MLCCAVLCCAVLVVVVVVVVVVVGGDCTPMYTICNLPPPSATIAGWRTARLAARNANLLAVAAITDYG